MNEEMNLECTMIRLSPAIVWAAVYLMSSRTPLIALPSPEELRQVISSFGFQLLSWRERPVVLVTHMYVHANVAHLAANVMSFVGASMEFGGVGVRDNIFNQNTNSALRRLLGSVIVMTTGGVVGGLTGHYIHCQQKMYQAQGSYGMGIGIVERFVGTVHKATADRVFVCGASAGISALCGFNAAYYGRWVSGIMSLLPAVAALFDEGERSSFLPGGDSATGHAAHVGGFVVGAILGFIWKRTVRPRVNYPRQFDQGRVLGDDEQRERWRTMFQF